MEYKIYEKFQFTKNLTWYVSNINHSKYWVQWNLTNDQINQNYLMLEFTWPTNRQIEKLSKMQYKFF